MSSESLRNQDEGISLALINSTKRQTKFKSEADEITFPPSSPSVQHIDSSSFPIIRRKSSRMSLLRRRSSKLLRAPTFVFGDLRIRNYTINYCEGGLEIDDAAQGLGNGICTTRFTWYNWLLLSFWSQFHRIANVYFVIVAILAAVYIKGAAVKTVVVFCVMMAQAFKDLYEDHKRSKDDKEENTRGCCVFSREQRSFISCEWQDCELGSLVRVEKGGKIPADLLIVASSDSSGIFFVSTASLDGETNLKQKVVPPLLHEYLEDTGQDGILSRLEGLGLEVDLDVPQPNLLSLDCKVELIRCGEKAGCGLDNFALRGCELQNTHWVIGIACYTGHATKIRMNSCKTASKFTDLESYLNHCVLRMLMAILCVSILYALTGNLGKYMIRCEKEEKLYYDWMKDMCRKTRGARLHDLFIKYAVMLWVVLPVTLYILFEILHIRFGQQIDTDTTMQDTETGKFARARNTSVIEDLGQVSFVFSDKTGTLTANEMRFAFCYVGDTKFGPFLPAGSAANDEQTVGVKRVRSVLQSEPSTEKESKLTAAVSEFFDMMAICHSVQLNEEQQYQAESPDELALVVAAKSIGYAWVGRERKTSGIGEVSTVEKHIDGNSSKPPFRQACNILCELPFSSDRKRMSVIIPLDDDAGAFVWTKGADSVLEALMKCPLPQDAREALDDFARSGYRTLIYGQRYMSASEYANWKVQWEDAAASMKDRAEKLDQVYNIAEAGLTFSGITAVEDRLQDDVPSTIESLRDAGIRVWVLTGDKVETAVEIARACKLFDDSMKLAYVVGAGSTADVISELCSCTDDGRALGIVLDGKSVGYILESPYASKALYKLAMRSVSCVCCRLSPLQKRKLIELVRNHDSTAITLAIGDGANDVPMIQGAHVGVGIRGKEGAASVQASDFAISQFCFLKILVFIHGRKAYRRLATFLCYFFYKSVVIAWPYLIHAFFSVFRGEVPISPFLDSLYAPLTSWSAAIVVAFDEDVPDDEVLASPKKYYEFGPSRSGLNLAVFSRWMATACVHGWYSWCLVIYLGTTSEQRSELGAEWWRASFAAFATILVTVHLKLVLVGNFHLGRFGTLALVGELLAFFIGTFIAGQLVEWGKLPKNTFCFTSEGEHLIGCKSDGGVVRHFFISGQIFLCILVPLVLVVYDLLVLRLRSYFKHWTAIVVELTPVLVMWFCIWLRSRHRA